MGRKSTKVKINCIQCNIEFETHLSEIKKGGGKFCSRSCAIRYRNLTNNPTKNIEVREKISKNHANVSGKNNPMYGKRANLAPSYIDGRSRFKGSTYQKIMQVHNIKKICNICKTDKKIDIHHIDGNHKNNDFSNLVYLCAKCHQTLMHKKDRDNKGKFLEKREGDNYEQHL